MGIDYSCQSVESEEETVNRIFKDMFKKQIQPEKIYENFLKCIYFDNKTKINRINRELFQTFLFNVLEDNRYYHLYKDYFNSIINKYSDIQSIRKIGLIIIDVGLEKNLNFNKKDIYVEHFTKFYLDQKEINIEEIIEKGNFKFLYNENISGNLQDNYDNNRNFINFFKKKELENLENAIKQCITDTIENNTNNLTHAMNNILTYDRLELLTKSWEINNKKLILFEILRNYTSLVEKFCLFPYGVGTTKDSIDMKKAKSSDLRHLIKGLDTYNKFQQINDENVKIKLRMEIDDFCVTKEKLLESFFELSATQMNGDAIRNWLFENARN